MYRRRDLCFWEPPKSAYADLTLQQHSERSSVSRDGSSNRPSWSRANMTSPRIVGVFEPVGSRMRGPFPSPCVSAFFRPVRELRSAVSQPPIKRFEDALADASTRSNRCEQDRNDAANCFSRPIRLACGLGPEDLQEPQKSRREAPQPYRHVICSKPV